MTYQPFTVPQFPGLNTRDEPEKVGLGGAASLSNVDLGRDGQLRTRAGLTKLNGSAMAGTVKNIVPYSATSVLALVNTTGTTHGLQTISSTGTVATVGATWSGAATGPPARFGTKASGGTAETILAFFPHLSGLRKYDGSAHAASVGSPTCVCVWALGNRLVQAGFPSAITTPSGADGSVSTVFFSDPGAPETFTATNFVHLRPGDGENIRAAVAWRELVFVFKETVMFVFYGTGVDTTGEPIFNYRPVVLPEPLHPGTGGGSAVAAGDDGVYFATKLGMYRTVGGDPQRVFNTLADFTLSDVSNRQVDDVRWANGRLYVGKGSGTDNYIHDPEAGWTKHTYAPGLGKSQNEWRGNVYFAAGENVYKLDPDVSTDDGTAISWSYQSGWYDVSGQNAEAFTRYASLRGTGSPTVAVLTDYGTSDSNAAAVTLGTAPTSDEGYHQKSYRGSLFAHKVSGTGAVTVDSLTHWVRSVRGGSRRAG